MKICGFTKVAAALCMSVGAASIASAQCVGYTTSTPSSGSFVAGTADIGNNCDDCSTVVPIPFSFTLYGTSYTSVNVGSNGYVDFLNGAFTFGNTCLPAGGTGPRIFAHWNDMRTDAAGNGIFTQTSGTAGSQVFTIEWRANFFDGTPGTANFALQLYEGTSNFDLFYITIPASGIGATSGVQSTATGPSTQFSCNTATLTTGLSVRYTCVAPTTGACCDGVGGCAIANSADCTGTLAYQGANSVCSPNPCTALLGACCATNGTCATTTSGGCTAGGAFSGAGTSCTPNDCAQPPANDDCPGTMLATSGGNATATGSTLTASTTVGAGSTCGLNGANEVWFQLVPDVSTNYTANVCSSSPAWDSVLSVHTACPGTAANQIAGACNDDGACGPGIGLSAIATPFALTAGTSYWVRVAGYPTQVGALPIRGNFILNINGSAVGRCCSPSGATCNITTQAGCIAPNIFTAATTCGTTCPASPGQCCAANGGCTVSTQAACTGTFNAGITTCTPNTCNQPSGSCCAADGGCTVVNGSGACTGTFTVAGVCTPNDCFQPSGSCCDTSGNCTISTGIACGAGTFTVGSTCGGPNAYRIVPSAAAFEDISGSGTQLAIASECDDCGETITLPFTFNYLGTDYTTVWVCSNGFAQFGGGDNVTFTNTAIPTAGVPNNMIAVLWDDLATDDGGDIYVLSDGAPGSQRTVISWQGVAQLGGIDSNSFQVVLFEGTNEAELRYGAITAETPAGDYTIGYEDAGGLTGASVTGASLGSGNTALGLTHSSPCVSANVACCTGATCTVIAAASCTGPNAISGGAGACNAIGNGTTPCCRRDYNHNAAGTVQDIFDFLSGYFTNNIYADANDSGAVSVQDIFDYLSFYFTANCP